MSETVNATAQATTQADSTTETNTEVVTTTAASSTEPVAASPTTAEVKTDEPAAKTQAEAKVVTEKYEFKMPENSTLSQAQVDKISQYAKEKGLSNDEAQVLLDREHGAVSDYRAMLTTEHQKLKDSWMEQAKQDPEIGGDKITETVARANEAFKAFGDDEFNQLLADTGYGNHPAVLKAFAKIGTLMESGKYVVSTSGRVSTEKSPEEILYPTHFKEANQ